MPKWGWLGADVAIAAGATLVAGLVGFGPIAADVSGRTAQRLKQEGRTWVAVAIDGRDVTLSGAAPEPADRLLASESADRVFGVRVVHDGTTVLPLATPYPFGLERGADGVAVIGAFPDEKTRGAMLARIAGALAGVTVTDDTTLARGAPNDLGARVDYATRLVADLAAGSVGWAGDALTISGDPRDFAAWQALERRLAGELPAGTEVASDTLRTPAPPRWSFSATAAQGRLVLDGFLPDAATRDRVLGDAARLFPGGVSDRTVLAPGAAAGTDAAIDFTIDALAQVTEGGAKIDPSGYTIAGRTKSWAIHRALEERLKAGAPGGLVLVGDGLVAPPPDPYRFGMKVSAGSAAIDGFLPDMPAHGRLLAALHTDFATIVDRVDVAPGAPAGFVDTLVALSPDLARLSDLDFSLSGTTVRVHGAAATAALGATILGEIGARLPAGYTLSESEVAVLPPPPQVDAATCERAFADVQSGDKIHFDTGEATLRPESTRVLDALVTAALRCVSARVTVEGHTDAEGDAAANQTLSKARAAAVVERLVAAGIAADRLTAVGYGETRPIADEATAEGRQQNRRIEFRVE